MNIISKLLDSLLKKENDNFKIPKSVQEVIPVEKIYQDGIFQVSKNKFSKCFKFTDINYSVVSDEDKENILLKYSDFLNSFDSNIDTKITIINRKVNKDDLEKNMIIENKDDNLNVYRNEYNKILNEKSFGKNYIIQEKILTITVDKKNIEEARIYFNRVYVEISHLLSKLGSKCIELNAEKRIKLYHDFYRPNDVDFFYWDKFEDIKQGKSFKDNISPDSFSFNKNYFEMGNKYGRIFFLKDYATYMKDYFISDISDISQNLYLSIDIKALAKDVAKKMIENIRMGTETNIVNWQRKQNKHNNYNAIVPFEMELERSEVNELLEDVTLRDQRIFFCTLIICLIEDTKEALESKTEALLSVGRTHSCQIGILNYQQMDGLNTLLPYGVKNITIDRTLKTESLASFLPFRTLEINHKNGIYYGENIISKNLIIADRKELLNGNSFILGVSGSGKSFAAKNEIVSLVLKDENADIIIIDPEREYKDLVKALGGEEIYISATSPTHINPMDINSNYGDGNNPIILKSEFMLSLCECIIGNTSLGPKEKSIIDRCVTNIYQEYQKNNYNGAVPTLKEFKKELLKQEEDEAKNIALAMELFADGSLNTFANPTNVNTNSRVICFDILDLGEQLMSIGMLIILDNILNRITNNRKNGRNTYIFIDEIYLLFKHEYSANFLFTLWKRVRKYGALCTGITQNVDDLLHSHTARTMLANSEFLIMLDQSPTDAIELSKLLEITDSQKNYITNVDVGSGLIKIGDSLIPFKNEFPKNTKLYSLMTTKIGEIKANENNQN